jgi:hypothetical protein
LYVFNGLDNIIAALDISFDFIERKLKQINLKE